MKVQEFKVALEEFQYFKKESDKEGVEPLYYLTAKVSEIKRGRSKYKTFHNATIYIDETIYNEQSLEKGDTLIFSDKVKWNSRPIKFTTYNEEKIKAKPAAKVKFDEQGRKYVVEYAYSYTLSAPMGTWFLDTKLSESIYWQVGRLKVFMDSEEELFQDPYYEFYLDNAEYEKLAKIENGETTAHAYIKNQSKGKCDVKIYLTKDTSIDKWRCKIEKTSEVY